MLLSRILHMVRTQVGRLRGSKRASVNIMFSLSLIPMIGMIGLGVDYGVAITDRAKLDNAADTAAIAAVATAKAYIAANPTDANGTANAIAQGIIRATNAFTVNAGSVPFAQYQLQTPQIAFSRPRFTATVTYTANVSNHFAKWFSTPYMNLSGKSVATADIPSYIDFYLLVDVSGSMGLPATNAGMTDLAKYNVDMFSNYHQNCQFACHYAANWSTPLVGYDAAVKYHIQLRSDAVNSAVCALIRRAQIQDVPNQYRIGIYPFINQMATLTPLTSDMSVPLLSVDCASTWPAGEMKLTSMLDTGQTQLATNNDPRTGTGSGGTHFDLVFPQMRSAIVTKGDGSTSAYPKPFVFLVTDGMQNGQHYSVKNGSNNYYSGSYPPKYVGYTNANFDGSSSSQIDPTYCTGLKNDNVTISILYIPYLQIPFVNGGSFTAENNKVNGFSPTLGDPLKQCASPGFFRTATSPDEITAALKAMFDQAIQVAHLTQ